MGLLEWAAHFKNVRGVLAFDPSRPPADDVVGWLVRKHRWREVGVPPCATVLERLRQRPFVPLSYPSEVLEGVVRGLEGEAPSWLLEGVALGLCYCAPLLCPGPELYPEVEPLCRWTLRTGDLPEAETLRHIRIAGYVPIDFFPQALDAYRVLKDGADRELQALIKERAEQAAIDGRKRFWRVESVPGDVPLLCYIDLLPLLASRRERLRDLLFHEEVGLLLTLTTAFFLRG